ncbi:MAG: hypothetical protein J5710_09135 [Treponema sp.]|nr:hypothetical protein [Treponema sp.]
MEDINSLSERKVLFQIINLLIEKKNSIEDLQFKNNKERELESEDDNWFNYVEKDGWIFQGHKFGKRIRLMNPSNIRVAKASKKDSFIKECRKLLKKRI